MSWTCLSVWKFLQNLQKMPIHNKQLIFPIVIIDINIFLFVHLILL